MSQKTVGLCIIVKDETADVARIANDYGKYFDAVYLTVTHKSKLEEIALIPVLTVSYFEWVKDFSKARNYNFDQAQTDYVFWIDSDDEIINPEGIKNLVNNYPDVDLFYMDYLYAFDESGNCTMRHHRERLIKNNKSMVWKGRVHETLVPVDDVIIRKAECSDVLIRHRATSEDNIESHKRNVEILVQEWNEHKENTDPRTIAYLASELSALRRFDDAIKFYEKHIQLSGWNEDKYLSWNKISENLILMFLEKGDKKLLETAVNALLEAVVLMPNAPDAYLTMGEAYWHLKQWDKAIEWTTTGLTKKPVETMPYHDPTRYTIRPLPILAYSYLSTGEIEKAYHLMAEAFKRAPKNPFIKDNFPFFETVYNETQAFKNFVNLAKYLEHHDKTKLDKLPAIIPDNLAGDDRFIQLRHRYSPAKVWNDKSVVIYCSQTVEEWGPPSLAKGIGGSEEAVIYLSKELKNLGYEVTVYCACGDLEGTWDGVEYKNYWHFNKNDMFNILISWRHNIFPAGISAKRKIVWMHDVPFKNDWDQSDFDSLDKVVVLSEFHKSLFPNCPPEKLYVSTNGINVADFIATDKKDIYRKPHRIIYGSSYNRGLENLLDMWPDILKECPLAELHIFYGWNTFDGMNAENQDAMKWKAKMIEKMNQPGVKEHGRVGHKKLLEEYAKSSVWAFPTFFQEINCITAIKAQAMGAFPVFHNLYALKDTCKNGWAVEEKEKGAMLAEFKEKLINALRAPASDKYRNTMQEEVRKKYSWASVAKDWSDNLFVQDRARTYTDMEDYRKQYSGYHLSKDERWDFNPSNIINGKPVEQPRFKWVVDNCVANESRSHLDIACSDGSLCYLLAEKGISSDGLDVDERGTEHNTKYAKDHNLNCRFYTGLFEEFEADKKYDSVSLLEVIEHVLDPEKFISKVNSLTDGYVFISTPHKQGYFGETNMDPLHLRYYDEDSMKKLIGDQDNVAISRLGDLLIASYKVKKHESVNNSLSSTDAPVASVQPVAS